MPYVELGTFRYSSGKTFTVFTASADFELIEVHSNELRTGVATAVGEDAAYPEFDAARWVGEAEARVLLVAGQLPAVDALLRHLD